MANEKGSTAAERWEVIAARPHNRGNPADGAEEIVIAEASEAEARRVFADTVATAAEAGYEYMRLRANGEDVDCWPKATGWTV